MILTKQQVYIMTPFLYIISLSHNAFKKLTFFYSCSGIDSQSGSIKTEPDEMVVEGPLDEIDVKSYLTFKKANEDGPEIRAGSVDSLIVKAAEVSKNGK